MKIRLNSILASIATLTLAQTGLAQIDSLATVVNNTNALGGVASPPSLAAYAYDPSLNRIFVAGFSGSDQQLRMIGNVDGVQTVQTQVFSTAWQLFDKGGVSTNGGGSPTPSGFLLNPKPIGAIPAYGISLINDIDAVVTTSGVAQPQLTQRIYSYNLGQSAGTTGSSAADVFTSVLTQQQYGAAIGTTSTSSLLGRQFAWSGDGQSTYFVDSSSVFGGVYNMPALGGTPKRLLATSTDINTEPAVLSSGGVDTVYFRGGGTTGNVGGLDKITYDGTTASARTVAVSAATINGFLENTGSTSITNFSMASDSDGNLYFNDTSSLRPGIYKLDALGRLSKVVSKAERQAVFATGTQTVNANTLRIQPRTVTYTNGSISFPVTQLLYEESTPVNLIAGAYVFKTGDFNRDNQVDQSDVNLLKTEVTTRGVQKTNAADLKYDLNGNGAVDWKDIKIFQQFDPNLYDGDANFDGKVDIADLGILASDWQTSGQSWLGADFTGDNVVDISDLGLLATNWQNGVQNPMGVSFSAALAEFGLPGAAVPEPAMMSVVGIALALTARRRRA